jgi:hypothetical protein
MKNYLAEKLVEWLLTNIVMYKNVCYFVTEALGDENKYTIHNLQAEIDNDTIWFGRYDIQDIHFDQIDEIKIDDDKVEIVLKDNKSIKIEIIK